LADRSRVISFLLTLIRERFLLLNKGRVLLLYREPDNEHDEWAIVVYLTEDDQIASVTKSKNETKGIQ